jgi:hypothetical protein
LRGASAFVLIASMDVVACRRSVYLDAGPPGVRVHLRMRGGAFGSVDERTAVYALSDRVHAALAAQHAGDVQGNEFGGAECVMIVNGSDPERMWQAMARVVGESEVARGGHAELRMADGVMRRVDW